MPVIFGHEIPAKTLWIGGGLVAAAVAVVVFVRARAAGGAPVPVAPADQPAAGGGMSIAAPSDAMASDYQQQLANGQLQAQSIANSYQQQLATQQQRQFDLQYQMQQAVAPALQEAASAYYQQQAHYQQDLLKARVACPGGSGVALDPATGQAYCRQKTSGGVLGIPLGDIGRTVSGFVSGVEAAAPTLGYQAANDAARYYLGKTFGGAAQGPRQQAQATVGTPPLVAPPRSPVTGTPLAGQAIGYEEIG